MNLNCFIYSNNGLYFLMPNWGLKLTRGPNIEIRRANAKAYFMKNIFYSILSQKIQKINIVVILKIS